MDNSEGLSTEAWLLRGISYVPGVLILADGRLFYLACGFGSLWKWQMNKLERAAGQPGLAERMDAGENCIVFDIPLAEVEVEFPWYYFSGGMKVWVGGVRYRLSFGKPANNASFSLSDGFEHSSGALANVFELFKMRQRGKAWKRALGQRVSLRNSDSE